MRKRRRKSAFRSINMKSLFKYVLLIVFALAVVATFVILWRDSRPQKAAYEIYTVERGNVRNTIIATGKIQPRDIVLIKPHISGIISELKKEPGDTVRVNEVIAIIKVIPEMATLNSAQARVKLAQISYDQVKEAYNRQSILFDQKIIAREEMEQSRAEFEKAQVEVRNSRDNLNIVEKGISTSMPNRGNTHVKSTIDGTVLNIPVKVGTSVIQSNTFNDGTTIATVADMNDMIFIGKLDETEIGKVYVGMPVKVTIGAIEKQEFEAQLEYIAPEGVEENGAIMFEIKAVTSIPGNVTIRSGYSANADIILDSAEGVVTVPEYALEMDKGVPYVYILQAGGTFKKQAVTLGISDGVNVEVKSGLTTGQKVRGNEISSK